MVHSNSKPSVQEKKVKKVPPPIKKASIWKCATCGQEFARLNLLVLHQRSHIRLSLSLKQKLKTLSAIRKKRKDERFVNREKEAKREKRKDETYLKKEISAMREKRKDKRFLNREKEAKREKRKDERFLNQEKEAKRVKRLDPNVKKKQREKIE